MVVANGISTRLFVPRGTETGIAIPGIEPEYKKAVANGVPPDDIPLNGLVLYLPLHLLYGSKVRSADDYKHTGTVTGTVWGPSGWLFDATDDKIDYGQPDVLKLERTDPFALVIWIKRVAGAGNRTILKKQQSGGAAQGYHILITASKLELILSNNSATNAIQVDATSSMLVGSWQMWVLNYDGSSAAAGVSYFWGNPTEAPVADTPVITTDTLTGSILYDTSVYTGSTLNSTLGILALYKGRTFSLADAARFRDATCWRFA